MTATNRMRGGRALARLSMRAIKRAPLRSLLIVTLIGLMVAVGSMVATVDRTDRITAQDQVDGELGSADWIISVALTSGGAPWGIFGSPDLPFGTGVCTTVAAPDGSPTTTCAGPVGPGGFTTFPTPPLPICVPSQYCGIETVPELTPEQQAVVDKFDDWKSTFDADAAAEAMRERLGVDVAVIREANSFDSQPRSPFVNVRSIEGLSDIDLTDPLNAQSVRLIEGRTPSALNEIAIPVDSYASVENALPLGSKIQAAGREMTVVGRIARAGRTGQSWGVVTPETLDASTFEPVVARFRIDGIDLPNDPRRMRPVLPTIEAMIGDQPIYAASRDLLAAPIGLTQWSIVQRDAAGEYGYGSQTASIATAIATTAMTGLIGMQVFLVIATAFTVGRRRRAREFGQLITVGADARHLRRLALTEGLLLGGLGAIVGIVVGLVFTSIGISQEWWGNGNPFQAGVRFSPVDWIGPVIVGVLAAVLAAWWPVRKIADAPLAGGALAEVPAARPAAYIPKLGALLAIGGVMALGAITVVSREFFYTLGPLAALLAILATLLGLFVMIGAILSWVGRRADGLPLLARLVVRNADRHRSRSWLVVGAFILTIGIPIAIGAAIEAYPGSFGGANDEADEAVFALHTQSMWRGGAAAAPDTTGWTEEEIAAYEFEAGTSIEMLNAVRQGLDEFGEAFKARAPEIVGDLASAPVIALEGVEPLDVGNRNSLYAGGLVAVATPELFEFLEIDRSLINRLNTTRALSAWDPGEQTTAQLVKWDRTIGPSFGPPVQGSSGPQYVAIEVEHAGQPAIEASFNGRISMIVSAEMAQTMQTTTGEVGQLFRAASPITEQQDSELRALADEIWWQTFDDETAGFAGNGVYLSTGGRGFSGPSPGTFRLIVAAIAAAVAALIALTTSALTAVESERELESLIATGARPSIRRRFLGAQALYHLAIAALLATPTAVIVYWVAVQADQYGPRGPVVPWLSILLSSIVMPLVVAALIFLLFRNGRPAISRRVT